MKFKKGDKIKTKQEGTFSFDPAEGTIIRVPKKEEIFYKVKIVGHPNNVGWNYHENELTLVKISGDDPKKKKADGKRIALGQKHERDYMKKIAKKQVEKLQKQVGKSVWGAGDLTYKTKCSKANLIRICKALIKYLERDKR